MGVSENDDTGVPYEGGVSDIFYYSIKNDAGFR